MDSLLPFLWGSFIPYNIPVYPGALRFADHPGVGKRHQRTWSWQRYPWSPTLRLYNYTHLRVTSEPRADRVIQWLLDGITAVAPPAETNPRSVGQTGDCRSAGPL